VADWSHLVKPSLVGIAPYEPGESVGELRERYGLEEVLKLNWNEGLFGPAPGVLDAAAEELANAWMYPERAYADLRDAVAAHIGVPPDHVVPAHGIQALAGILAGAFLTPGVAAVLPTPTYGLYAQAWRGAGATVEQVPARADLGIDLEALAAAARRTGARLALVVDPNNPTAQIVTQSEWDDFLDALPPECVAVVDEAYAEYVEPARRVERQRDVLDGRPVVVLRSFSKIFGLAGLRLGYAIAAPELGRYLNVVQEPFNVNRAALAAGRASLAVPGLVERRRCETAEARELLAGLLRDAGAEPLPSHANFLLVRVGVDDRGLTERLRQRGILIRAGSEYGLAGMVRITVGPAPLMERAAAELAAVRAELLAG
jgi:histidinol-phosphate aminotransferase